MKRKTASKMFALTMIVAMCVSLIAGCSNKSKEPVASPSIAATDAATESNSPSPVKEELLTFNVFSATEGVPPWANEQDDVMVKHIQEKFNIKVGEVSYLQGITLKERMNLFIASNELPDVISVYGDSVTVPSSEKYAELGELIKQYAPNYMKTVPEEYWKDSLYNGKTYSYGSPVLNGLDFPDDIYATPNQTWDTFFTTESLLTELGYSFTPNTEIVKQINESGKKPTADLYKITPEIKTPDDFYTFLKKIKDTMPKVNGQDVIPFSIPLWLEPHFGATFGLSGAWKYDPDSKEVSSFLTDKYSKDYWKFINKLYNDGLLDKDFAIQKTEQLNDKILQGRVKAFMWSNSYPSNADVQKAIKTANPNDSLRAIPLPKQPGSNFLGVDHIGKASVLFYIRKDFKDIPRLLKLWDWVLSDEARELAEWGPADLGLWTEKDGKKVWTDEMFAAISSKDADYLKANYYGKGLGGGNESIASKIYNGRVLPLAGGYNPNGWSNSYKFELTADDIASQASYVSANGNDSKGFLSNGVSESSSKINGFIYGEFEQQFSAKLFTAKDDADFDKKWDEVLKHFNDRIGYPAALKEMQSTFKARGFDVNME